MNIQQEQLLKKKNAALEKELATKNRELEIEAALERVRAKTNAMHTSKDLLDVITVLVDQFQLLGFKIHSANFNTSYREKDWNLWLYNPGTPMYPDQIHIPYLDNPFFNRTLESIAKGSDFTSFVFTKEEKDGFLDHLYANTIARNAPEERKKFSYSAPGFAWSTAYLKNTALTIANYDAEPYTEEQNAILRRFGNVFEQTYTRFLDLQKAEAQSREAQIDLGLERVRARAMAMQTSEELNALIGIVFTELTKLDLVLTRCVIIIYDAETKGAQWWMANSEAPSAPMNFFVKYANLPFFNMHLKGWEERDLKWQYILEGENKIVTDNFLFNETELKTLPGFVIEGMKAPHKVYLNVSFNNFGNLTLATLEPLSEKHFDILLRFAKVFDLTYTRFNDLQKAEAQARESQIQLALERVRARTMSMQKTSEFVEVINVIGEQFIKLGFDFDWVNFSANGINVSNGIDIWNFVVIPGKYKGADRVFIPFFDHPVFTAAYEKFQEYCATGNDFYALELDKETKDKFADHLFANTVYKDLPDELKKIHYDGNGYITSSVFLKDTWLSIGSYKGKPFTDEQNSILKRFSNAFGQAYTRFLDLEKAEAQAREAQIEAGLERVRSHSLAMQKSEDLKDIATVVLEQLQRLGFVMEEGAAVHIQTFSEDSKEVIQWSATPLQAAASYKIPYNDNPVFADFIKAKHDGESFFFHKYSFEEKNKWFDWAFEHTDFKRVPDEFKKILLECESYAHWAAIQKNSAILVNNILGKSLSEEQSDILKRFSTVFEQAYIRFLDLQTAETNAKEAIKQAALDRIRADIASMRTINDLDRITPLIWNELNILGVPFIRCGVFIMDEEEELIHTFLSTPDGKAIAAFHIPYDTPGNIGQVLNHWQQKKIYTDHWDEAAFTEFAHSLVKQKALASSEEYLKTLPNGGFYLHFLPFLQGMLYVGNTTQLNEDEINLIQSVADAFSTAYARYEDFNKLENAKQKIEITLAELKSAQKQLIQSEKMASLGELTAGIAHEIQNPLNFVNNFSEVNDELISELVEEVDKKNYDEVKLLASDIKENSEKINHHGKRAGAIVTGMLQHSRTSTGQKELTDINALADEYLRLSYHGLRAKDKSFNATMKTDFDSSIGKINVVPQDIGRVFLNLFNNAFYATSEKLKAESKKQNAASQYVPIVTVVTKKLNDKMEIKVRDNGNGIPQNIVDKIFQPFFTTKPTGEGTGLGLSLSYDIVKAHGGELKVNTEEDKGSEFIIMLPS